MNVGPAEDWTFLGRATLDKREVPVSLCELASDGIAQGVAGSAEQDEVLPCSTVLTTLLPTVSRSAIPRGPDVVDGTE